MDWRSIRGYFKAGDSCQDVLFLDDMRQLSHLGLEVIGWTEIAVALFALLAQFLTDLTLPAQAVGGELYFGRASQAALIILVGLVTLAASRTRAGRMHPALLLCSSAVLSSAMLILSALVLTPHAPDEYIAAHITTVLLVAITAAPLEPRQTCWMGSAIWLAYVAAYLGGWYWHRLDPTVWHLSHLVFLALLTVLATAISAVLYAQRITSFRAQRDSIRMAEALSAAPVRALLSENAISVGRLAAALTHELNTPLGALKSSIDTLLVVAAKQATAPPEQQPRLVTMQAELRRSVNDGMERLKKVIARLQRFIDLDHTERQAADLNELLSDVVVLLKPSLKEGIKLDFECQPVPKLHCRPQQLTTVFSSVLSNAINSVSGEGRVVVSTEIVDSLVRVRFQDNGRGMEEAELETIFDPGFRVLSGRVSTGNWSLFSARQIVFEHGGEIQISSTPGKGTTVDVLLPI